MPGLSEASEARILSLLEEKEGPVSHDEAAYLGDRVQQSMVAAAEVLIGVRADLPSESEDWSDPADPGTWKKPYVRGEL